MADEPLLERRQALLAATFSSLGTVVLLVASGLAFWDAFHSDNYSGQQSRLGAAWASQAIACGLLTLPIWLDCCYGCTASERIIRLASIQTCRAAGVALSLTGLGLVLSSLPAKEGRSMDLVVGTVLLTTSCLSVMTTFWPHVASRDESAVLRQAVRQPADEERIPFLRSSSEDLAATTDEQQQQYGDSIDEEQAYHLMVDEDAGDEDRNGTSTQSEVAVVMTNIDAVSSHNTPRVSGAKRLFQEASPQILYLYAGFAVLLVRLPFSLSIPHFVSTTLSALAQANFDRARHEIFLLLLLGSIDAALDFWCVFLFGYANIRIVKGLRLGLFAKLIRQEVSFFDMTPSGELASRLNSDCSNMANDLTWFFRMSIESAVRIVGITAYMLIRSPILGGITLTIVPIVGVINKFYGDWLRRNATEVQDALAEANAVAQEALANVRTVIAFCAERRECKRYEDRIERQFQLDLRQLCMQGVYYMAVSTFLINTVTQATLLWIGTRLVQQNKLSAEVMLAFMLYQGQLQNETLNIFVSYSSFLKCCGAGEKVFALMDRRPPAPSISSPDVHVDEPGEPDSNRDADQLEVEFKDVSFRYPTRPEQPVLSNLNLKINKGKTIALCGASGSGKTTIVNLLQRFYDPSSGVILVNGADLKHQDLRKYRRKIGVVTQDPALFCGSILENITYGINEEDQTAALVEDVRRAAQLANADVFIRSFPESYDTLVGERGVQLSGGQKQRISIARAIIKTPSLLLLDEATSSLDAESERLVQAALDRLLEQNDMTTVIVAHRLCTVRNADSIAFLHEGRIVEQGTHEELLQRPKGMYKRIVEQAEKTGILPEAPEVVVCNTDDDDTLHPKPVRLDSGIDLNGANDEKVHGDGEITICKDETNNENDAEDGEVRIAREMAILASSNPHLSPDEIRKLVGF